MTFELLPRSIFPTPAPLFCDHKGAVNEVFTHVQVAALFQVAGYSRQYLVEDIFLLPMLEATLANLV